MLVMSRQRDESIFIGGERTAHVVLTDDECFALGNTLDPVLAGLGRRMMTSLGPIPIQVVDIRGDKVRLGITAPKELSVHRSEVYDAIRREQQKNATRAGDEAAVTVRPAVDP